MRFNPRVITALAMVIVSLVLVAIAMGMTWWSASGSGGGTTGSADLSLGQVCLTGSGFGSSGCYTYQQMGIKAVQDAFGLTGTLMLIGIVLAILALVFLILGAFFPRIGIIGFICALIGSIMVLLAPIYLFAALPGAFKTDPSGLGTMVTGFFGSASPSPGVSVTYGGAAGWFMAIVAFVIYIITAFMILKAMKSVAPLGNVRMGLGMAPSPYGPYQPGAPTQPYQPAYGQPYQPVYGAQPVHPQPAPVTPVAAQPVAPQQPGAARYCPRCGKEAPVGSVFCPICGTQVP